MSKVPYPNYAAGLPPAVKTAVNAAVLPTTSAGLTALSRRALNARAALNAKGRAGRNARATAKAAARVAKATAALNAAKRAAAK